MACLVWAPPVSSCEGWCENRTRELRYWFLIDVWATGGIARAIPPVAEAVAPNGGEKDASAGRQVQPEVLIPAVGWAAPPAFAEA